MPKHKPLTDKANDLKKFIRLTWEVVRRNPVYRENYNRLLQNYGLTPEDVKRKKGEEADSTILRHIARQRMSTFDFEKGRSVWEEEDEAPDSERCNLAYMVERWGFACDPDEPVPYGRNWHSACISKSWLNERKKSGPVIWEPLMIEKFDLQKLPGILAVNRWPECLLTEADEQKWQEYGEAIKDGWGIKSAHDLKQALKDIYPRGWEVEDPPQLTITVNLQAPSYLIQYALEFIIFVCKADLRIKEKKIEEKYIMKCLKIYDMHQEGYSAEHIADDIDLNHYKKEEVMSDGLDDYLRDWGIPQVERCLKDAEEMIKNGSIIRSLIFKESP
ncbi:MAG: hypothetical protein FJ128_01230 [Deltaproteobacteria bacterium]|nr:hypothetical protein [Deltaproteobacteria bacterium]MBM4283859.1 hypothetical protein [Deltaproteobacteria bacterium]